MITTDIQRIHNATGRAIAVHTLQTGTSGRTVVFCHPSPGSGMFDPDPSITAAANVTLLSVDRPGYGASDPVTTYEWATISSSADDIALVLHELGIDRVDVVGWSSGGRVALALAARHPDLVHRVVMQGTPAPHEEIPWIDPVMYDGLLELSHLPVDEIRLALTTMFEEMSDGVLSDDVLFALLGVSPADNHVLMDLGARERVVSMLRHAFDQGVAGMVDDIMGPNLRPWGFCIENVKASVLLQYGDNDPIAGYAHGAWWRSHLPQARLEMLEDVGHLVAIAGWKRTLDFLAA